ncbi:MAG: hypothetical protein LPJ91_03310 [Pseudazoarcus pumilus]|nr:hypothetical protein [Pseudazoarcus pumilus]
MKTDAPREFAHLTKEQLTELYARYRSGEKNDVLIADYDLNVQTNKLFSLFPALERPDLPCPYCSIPMYAEPLSKNAAVSEPLIECAQCGHRIYPKPQYGSQPARECACQHCTAVVRDTIRQVYSTDDILPVEYPRTSVGDRLALFALIRAQADGEFDYIQPLDDPNRVVPLAPTREMEVDILQRLYRNGVINIDPDSHASAFDQEAGYKSFYLSRVAWLPNLSLDGVSRADLSLLFDVLYSEFREDPEPAWEDFAVDSLYTIAREEVMQAILLWGSELRVEFVAHKKTREIVTQLLHNFSVSECLYFAKKAVDDAHLFYARGMANSRKHAGNTIPGRMLSLADRALAEHWNVIRYSRNSTLPRSAMSLVFHGVLFPSEDEGFKKAPGRYWSQDLAPRYFKHTPAQREESLTCQDCGSADVEPSISEGALTLTCKDCGAQREFIET